MIFSIIMGVLIFGFAGWALYRSIQKGKQGKCAGCSIAKTCQAANGADKQ
ncbi:MAG: FeoB-associated Cys-rich membrane protein [Gorillibacterium sp.]|nr:FeoB-associated Cys-rich membrane protein [Gorillibacterium sp.]